MRVEPTPVTNMWQNNFSINLRDFGLMLVRVKSKDHTPKVFQQAGRRDEALVS
jgi:hypothetical protein